MQNTAFGFALVVLGLASVACTNSGGVQQHPQSLPLFSLAISVDSLPGEYTHVVRLVEANDSIVVVSDPADRTLWRINLSSNVRTELGQHGDGPGEYRQPGRVVLIHRDSVALLTGQSYEGIPIISIHTGAGRTHRLALDAAPHNSLGAAARTMPLPRPIAADTFGRFYAAPLPGESLVGSGGRVLARALQEAPIVRFSLNGEDVDTLARLEAAKALEPPKRNENGAPARWISLGPYGYLNEWQALGDGRLLLVIAENYELRLVDETGHESKRFRIPWKPIPVSSVGWEQHVARSKGTQAQILRQALRSAPTLPPNAGAARTRLVPNMPKTLPPVAFIGRLRREAFVVGDDAFIPVNRVDPPDAEYWDVIDLQKAEPKASFSLPPRHRLIHVGKIGAYVVTEDENDVERILLVKVSF